MSLKFRKTMTIGGSLLVLSSLTISGLAPTATASVGNPCAIGETWLQPTSIEKLPDGGQFNDYWINGELNQVPIPPPGFKPADSNNATLIKYGLPERPTETQALSNWNTLMSNWRPSLDRGLCETKMQASILTGANWAGYDATASSPLYIAAQGDFKQPAKGSTSCTNSQEVSWAGIGGVNTKSLMQDGTGITTGGGYYAWYEYLDSSGSGINVTSMPSVTVHSGDSIHSYVVHQTSGLGQTTFYVQDGTTGTSQSVIVNLGSAYYDGSTVEWIDERPTVSGSFASLTNFGTVNWTNVQGEKSTGTWYGVGSLANNEIDMLISSHYLAFPYALSSNTTFSDSWYSCS